MRRFAGAWIAAAALACGSDKVTGTTPPPGEAKLAVRVVASGLSSPTYLTAPTGDSRLFIVEQPGRVRIVQSGSLLSQPFLDITSKVLSGGERGLLSVAFHPSYATNGFLFVYYTDLNGDIRVERYTVSSNANVADATSVKLILSVAHPTFNNHNGGLALFGPDGMLYLGLGDGGSAGDPNGNAQNSNVLLGKLLRLNVDVGGAYAIPSDNPFAGVAGKRGEIWAYGLRNPWRYSFDAVSGNLYIADVGQDLYEEVDVVSLSSAGVNYGWNVREGASCYNASSCVQAGLQLPVLVYDHSGGACSIVGGYVYRGAQIPSVAGNYFYSDFCAGWLRSFKLAGGQATEQHDWGISGLGAIQSFGRDAAGELYLLSQSGILYKIVAG